MRRNKLKAPDQPSGSSELQSETPLALSDVKQPLRLDMLPLYKGWARARLISTSEFLTQVLIMTSSPEERMHAARLKKRVEQDLEYAKKYLS